jgi:hypothetical protein
MQYLSLGFFPINAPAEVIVRWNGKVQPESWPRSTDECKARSLRQVGKDFGVSREAVKEGATED